MRERTDTETNWDSYESIYLRQKDGNRTERSDRGRIAQLRETS